jgi:hypothetical protein
LRTSFEVGLSPSTAPASAATEVTAAGEPTPAAAANVATAAAANVATATAANVATATFISAPANIPALAAYGAASTVCIAARIAIVATASVVAAAIVAPSIPRAGTDEDATGEPFRAIVAIRCAGIRIVVVVAISAHRWPISIATVVRADTHADRNLSTGCRNKKRYRDSHRYHQR